MPVDRLFAFSELSHIVEGLFPNSNVRWVDHPSSVWMAERKLQQLRAAVDLGVPIPRTIISTELHKLQKFVKTHPNGVICKPIFRGINFINGEAESAYTRIVRIEELEQLAEERTFPTLLQELIPKGKDLRITVVGDKFYGVEIITSKKIVDWRVPEAKPKYSRYDVPEVLKIYCKKILSHFGLTYGAFDFAVDPGGDSYFLEVNAVGEWAWLDRELNLGIREALINFFYGIKNDDYRFPS